jgi:hypothetical protein
VQESDLEDLIFTVRLPTGVIEVECVVGECSVSFIDSADAAVDVDDINDIVGVRWSASGEIVTGSLTADY